MMSAVFVVVTGAPVWAAMAFLFLALSLTIVGFAVASTIRVTALEHALALLRLICAENAPGDRQALRPTPASTVLAFLMVRRYLMTAKVVFWAIRHIHSII